MSKHTKRRRETHKSSQQVPNNTNINQNSHEENNAHQNSNTLVTKTVRNFGSPEETICHSITPAESNSNHIINKINNKTLSFQSKLASFIISSKLARHRATELLKFLKSVDDLTHLKSLPTDSRTLLSTPRSQHINIRSIGEVHILISVLLMD